MSSTSPRAARRSARASGSSPPTASTPSWRTSGPTRSTPTTPRWERSCAASAGSSIPSSATSARVAGIGRAHANEILWTARLSPFRLSTDLGDDEVATLATAIHDDLARALELRLEGKGDADVYRIHGRFGEPCPRCGETLRRVDFEEHTITYCPACQTGGRVLKDRRLSRLLR